MNRIFKTHRAPALVLLALLPAACSDASTQPVVEPPHGIEPGHPILASSAGVSFEVGGETLAPGSSATLHLSNGRSSSIGYNLCFHDLEQRQSSGWAPLGMGRICTTEIRSLAPGADATYPVTIPEALGAGEYRYRVAVHLTAEETFRDVVTGSFVVN